MFGRMLRRLRNWCRRVDLLPQSYDQSKHLRLGMDLIAQTAASDVYKAKQGDVTVTVKSVRIADRKSSGIAESRKACSLSQSYTNDQRSSLDFLRRGSGLETPQTS
jgi:hypothetical protein